MTDFTQSVLGETNEVVHIERMEECRRAALAITKQCKRSLHIVSYDLDPIVYDNAYFIDAVQRLATSGPRAKVQIIVVSPRKVIDHGHRLIELARRLSSHIEIRKINSDLKELKSAYLIGDECAVIYRKESTRYEGFVNFDDRGFCRRQLMEFKDSWEKSDQDINLRRLHI